MDPVDEMRQRKTEGGFREAKAGETEGGGGSSSERMGSRDRHDGHCST